MPAMYRSVDAGRSGHRGSVAEPSYAGLQQAVSVQVPLRIYHLPLSIAKYLRISAKLRCW
jgi:hypothetical protein